MKLKILLILIFISIVVNAQYNGKNFALSVNYTYTATSKLYLQPNSSDAVLRGTHEYLDNIYNFSTEFGYRVYRDIVVGISLAYIQKTFTNTNIALGDNRASMKDGYNVIPVELTIYYTMPFSTDYFKFFMGGGGGLYFGNHIRTLGDVTASTISRKIGYGIQIAVGMDYLLNDQFAVRGQIRFSDPEFEMKNKYSNRYVTYEGKTYYLSADTFDSKVNIDGISFAIGLVFQF